MRWQRIRHDLVTKQQEAEVGLESVCTVCSSDCYTASPLSKPLSVMPDTQRTATVKSSSFLPLPFIIQEKGSRSAKLHLP